MSWTQLQPDTDPLEEVHIVGAFLKAVAEKAFLTDSEFTAQANPRR